MKKIAISILGLFLLFASVANAQEAANDIRFGVKAGINVANISIKANGVSISPSSVLGGTGGFFATIPVSSAVSVQPELLYSMLGYKISSGGLSGTANYNYLVLPLLVKYGFAESGFAAYAGPQIGYLLSAKEKSGGMSEDAKDGLKKTDVAGIIGVEYTLPVGFNLSARYQLGLTNIVKDAGSDESGKLNALTFTVGYRF